MNPALIGLGALAAPRVLGPLLRRKRSIADKVVLITGASRGLGAELAEAISKEGVKLCIVARNQSDLDKVADACRKAGAKEVLPLACDVSDLKALERMVATCKGRLGPVQILINNAGIETANRAEVPDAASIAQLNAVNVTAPMALVNMVLADMKAAKYGVILTVSSGLAGMYMPYLAAYAASKAAINNYSAGLACELRGTGVSACCVMPGLITGLKDGGMGQALFGSGAVNKFTINPMLALFRCQAKGVIRTIISHVKMGAPYPVVNAMRMPVSIVSTNFTLFPIAITNLMWALNPLKKDTMAVLDVRGAKKP
mmetsp:Transcript_13265/g.25425  ORF Transcript_13265/g.25425 Transcript_13265/m.25425 type:complete len:314 (-) Transcript_13265:222-1163(-)|eukprot:CAMPEP_0114251562 /NCGR_PEP_ID=MMETSP0058-20121206/15340_1 /TAXON_ID=36894 /ORGANISM="Pyramimonas parkeae, CCMP726" /LENGTH=313 /DNA_ID=CAMNT_0001365379 /DNA_START=75 /DNA_END=1016 /DNA_ORIENTATION=-